MSFSLLPICLLILLLPSSLSIGFTLDPDKKYCINYNNTVENSIGYISMRTSGDPRKVAFEILYPLTYDGWRYEEEETHIYELFDFNITGLYRFCAENLENKEKKIDINIDNLNETSFAHIEGFNATDRVLKNIYDNLVGLKGTEKARDSLEQNYVDLITENIHRSKVSAGVKIFVIAVVTIFQLYILKNILNRRK